jgi:hypothetical protein
MKLTWDVQEHYEEQEIVVTESEVQCVWHLQTPQLLVGYVRLSCIQAQKFTSHSNGVQHHEKRVTTHIKTWLVYTA